VVVLKLTFRQSTGATLVRSPSIGHPVPRRVTAKQNVSKGGFFKCYKTKRTEFNKSWASSSSISRLTIAGIFHPQTSLRTPLASGEKRFWQTRHFFDMVSLASGLTLPVYISYMTTPSDHMSTAQVKDASACLMRSSGAWYA
jgi:hypothetical protein